MTCPCGCGRDIPPAYGRHHRSDRLGMTIVVGIAAGGLAAAVLLAIFR